MSCRTGAHINAVSCTAVGNVFVCAAVAGVRLDGHAMTLAHLSNNAFHDCDTGIHFQERFGVCHLEGCRISRSKVGIVIERCDSRVVVEATCVEDSRVAVRILDCDLQGRSLALSPPEGITSGAAGGQSAVRLHMPSKSSATHRAELFYNSDGPHLIYLQLLRNGIGVVADGSRAQMRGCTIKGVEQSATKLATPCLLYTSPSPRDRG